MTRPPRDPHSSLLSRSLLTWSLAQGALGLLAAGAVVLEAARRALPDDEIRSLAFLTLVVINLTLIFVNRTFSGSLRAIARPNPWLWSGLGLVGAALIVIFVWSEARGFLALGSLRTEDFTVCGAVGLALLVVLQSAKALRFHSLRT